MRFRLFILWLVVAAIPLQGLAAASMLFCGPGPHHARQQAAITSQVHVPAVVDSGSRHDHGKHSHAGEPKVKKDPGTAGKTLADVTHRCGVCASCCSGVAITELPRLVAFTPVPRIESAEPFVLIRARASPVPDKPPRA